MSRGGRFDTLKLERFELADVLSSAFCTISRQSKRQTPSERSERQGAASLCSLLERPQTRKRCEWAVGSFFSWLGQTSQTNQHAFEDLVEALFHWIEELYQESDSIGLAEDDQRDAEFLSSLSTPSSLQLEA